MNLEKIAVLSTSSCCKHTWDKKGDKIIKSEPSNLLTRLVTEGYTIYLANAIAPNNQRESFLSEIISQDRWYVPANPTMSGYLDTWKKLFDDLKLTHPNFENPPVNWLDYRNSLSEQGVIAE